MSGESTWLREVTADDKNARKYRNDYYIKISQQAHFYPYRIDHSRRKTTIFHSSLHPQSVKLVAFRERIQDIPLPPDMPHEQSFGANVDSWSEQKH